MCTLRSGALLSSCLARPPLAPALYVGLCASGLPAPAPGHAACSTSSPRLPPRHTAPFDLLRCSGHALTCSGLTCEFEHNGERRSWAASFEGLAGPAGSCASGTGAGASPAQRLPARAHPGHPSPLSPPPPLLAAQAGSATTSSASATARAPWWTACRWATCWRSCRARLRSRARSPGARPRCAASRSRA